MKHSIYPISLKIDVPKGIFLLIVLLLLFSANSDAIDCIETRFLFDIEPGANQPSDIAIAPNGDIYLVDGVNNRIIVTGGDGRWKFDFGSYGSGKGKFKYPLGIDISPKGRVFVADSGNHRIQVFDLKGRFLYMFSTVTLTDREDSDPVDVVISPINNYVYVSDNDNHTIKVFNRKGILQFQWGEFGEEYGYFRYPGIMTINKYNEIFVVDVLNTRVQKFDPFGKFISDIGTWGVTQGKLFRPKGVAIDSEQRIFISDSYMGVIQVFTDLGRVLGVLCRNGNIRRFTTPVGMAFDRKGRLLVVEMRANKITVLKVLE